MKKILVMLMISLFFWACNEKEEIVPIRNTDLKIELYGAFFMKFIQNPDLSFRSEHLDTLDYTLIVSVNGLDHYYNINKVVNANFVGIIYENTINDINKNDVIRVYIKDNIYPSDSYVYMNIFTNIYRKARLELEEFEDVGVKITGDKLEYVTLD